MQIIVAFDGDIQQYLTEFRKYHWDEVDHCPACQAKEQLVGHGVYWRKPRDHEQVYPIPIRRWLCKACRHTISALPNILLPGRWYVLNMIQAVLLARFTQQSSWRQLAASWVGTPHLRTAQRWCCSFHRQAWSWLAAVQIFLAQQDSLSPFLDPTGEIPLLKDPAQALLEAAVHLLAWGKTCWTTELSRYSLNNRLNFLWLWGSGRSLGRLV